MPYGAKNGTVNWMDFVSFGRGEDALLLIPGLGDGLRTVKGMALSLSWLYREYAKAYRVYVFSRRNALPEGFTIRDMADDLKGAMDALGLRRADVLGVSQGGMIAQYLAIYYPKLVRRLALGVTAARVNPVMEGAVNGWIRMAGAGDYGAIVRDMLLRMYSAEYIKRYGWLFPAVSRLTRPRERDVLRFINLARACLTCSSYPELDRIKCLALVLGGKDDKVLTCEASREIAGALGCELYMYEGLGHAAYEEAKDFNSRISRFFNE